MIEVSSIAPSHPILNQDPKDTIPMLVDTLKEEDLEIVTESLHFLEKACKSAESSHNCFAVYEEMVKSQSLFNALVMVTSKAFETMKEKTAILRKFPNDTSAQQAMESSEKRAQTATNILRGMVSCKCQMCRNSGGRAEHSLSACCCIVAAAGITVLTLLQQASLVRIRNNCVITIHTVLYSLDKALKKKIFPEAKEMFMTARKQFMDGK